MEELFQEVQSAFAVLSDPHERRWYDLHREAILTGKLAQENKSGPPASVAEPPAADLTPFFSASAFEGFGTASARGFYTIFAAIFREIAAEESELLAAPDVSDATAAADSTAPTRPPPFGDAASPWAECDAFYSHWQVFETRRTYAAEDRHSAQQLERANKQRRKAMERENHKLRSEARRKRQVGTHAL